MKFAVGYQLFSDNSFIDSIIKRKHSVSEVYFSWGDFPNGSRRGAEPHTVLRGEFSPIVR